MSGQPERFRTAGEALCRRELRGHKRFGVDHFVIGQHDVFVEEGIAYVTFVDAMGHAVNIPFEREAGEWKPVGVMRRAGQYTVEPIKQLPKGFELSEAILAQLATLDVY